MEITQNTELVAPVLIEALKHKEDEVRRHAVVALGRIGPNAKEAVPFLIEALEDEEDEVQRQAIIALGKIGPDAKGAVSLLTETLEDEDNGRSNGEDQDTVSEIAVGSEEAKKAP